MSSLESQIAKAQQIAHERHESISKEQKHNYQFRHLTDKQVEHQQKLSITKVESTEPTPNHAIPVNGRRDLSKLLAATPEQICNKLEQLIISQKNSGQAPSSDELSNMQQWISRLTNPTDKEEYNNFIQHLMKDLEKVQDNHVQKYINTRVDDDVSRDKQVIIREYHAHRINKIQQLSTRREQLDVDCKQVEVALSSRVKELHADPQIQSALT